MYCPGSTYRQAHKSCQGTKRSKYGCRLHCYRGLFQESQGTHMCIMQLYHPTCCHDTSQLVCQSGSMQCSEACSHTTAYLSRSKGGASTNLEPISCRTKRCTASTILSGRSTRSTSSFCTGVRFCSQGSGRGCSAGLAESKMAFHGTCTHDSSPKRA